MNKMINILDSTFTLSDFEAQALIFESTKSEWQFNMLLILLCVVVLGSVFTIYILRQYYVRQVRSLRKELLESRDSIEVETKKEIARELHDHLGSTLSTVKLYFQQIEKENGSSEKFRVAHRLLDEACNETRRISHSLASHSITDQDNFLILLFELFDRVKVKYKVNYDFHVKEMVFRQTIDKISMYKIFQELLTNSVKHSTADEIWLRSASDQEYVYLTLEENGEGFNETAITKGMGITNIQARIVMLGGGIERYTIDDRFGTTIKIPRESIK